MQWMPLCLCFSLVLAGCIWGSSSECSCAAVGVTVHVPESVAGDVTGIEVGPEGCGTALAQCVSARASGGCGTYSINLVGSGQVEHGCDATVAFVGGRKSTTHFTWRVDPDGCCGNRTFHPGASIVLPLPAIPDGGTHD